MLKEQVITPRGGRGDGRGAVTTKGRAGDIVQRPAARGKSGQSPQGRAKSKEGAWRKALAWAPAMGKLLVAVCAGLFLFKGYRVAASSSFFQLRSVDVVGVSQASEDQIRQIVRRAAGPVGVWRADLAAISAELERQPWVRAAVVSRVLPSGLRVRIIERVPRVVVRTGAGRFVWVDDEGVAVGALTPSHQQPAFFMRGWDESGAETTRADNRARVAKFIELEREWTGASLASRVSEVNLDDLRDVRAQLAGDDSQIEVRLGKEDLTKRLRLALETLDAQRQTPRGAFITYVDMTQGKRAVIGFNPSARQAEATNSTGEAPSAGATSEPSLATSAVAQTRPAAAKKSAERRRVEPKAGAPKSDRRAAGQANDGAIRPRRVGRGV